MKNNNELMRDFDTMNKRRSVAFQTGQRFRFPDDQNSYEFIKIEFEGDTPVVTFHSEYEELRRKGFYLSDLIKIQ